MAISTRFVGKRIVRQEDARFVTGHGSYVDDIAMANTLHVAFARSDFARGALVSVDTSVARSMPGVVAVYLAADINHLVLDSAVDDDHQERPFRLLADGDVRFVGEPVAMVVADSRYSAEDAVEMIEIDVDAQPALVDMDRSLDDDAPIVHPDLGSNLFNAVPRAENPALDEVLASAPVVLTETFHQHRYSTVPMETRGTLASWDPYRQEMTVWISTQGPHGVRSLLARALGIDDSRIRVIMPDVGGSFGLKMYPSPEEIGVAIATWLLGRPVKWIQDRRENLMCDQQAREDHATVTLAANEDGVILGAQVDFVEGAGAFPAGGSTAAILAAMVFTGPYKIPVLAAGGKAVLTNQMGRGGYRGPWMIETVVREQMIDRLAVHLGIDPVEIRRRNVIGDDDMPYMMPSGMTFDQMTAAQNLEQAAEMIDYDGLRVQQQAWRAEGRLVGIGVSLFPEPSAMVFGWMSTDGATVRIGHNGRADVVTSAASHGQGLETTIAQVVADELGLDVEDVRVLQGDTDSAPLGPGTGGSRSAVIAGTAALEAAREVRGRMLAIVAHALEASPDDLEIVDHRVQVKGTPTQGMTIKEVARKAYTEPAMLPPGVAPGLESQARYTPENFCTWSNACHMCVVEVDRDTGLVEILRYVVSEDCGVMINPNIVEGQIAGGVAQGLGGVLYEHQPYDDAGNPLATTFVDYLLPTASEVPMIEYGHIETPSPTNPGGHKGLGEGGAIGAPPALINAVSDALAPLGVQIRSQPLGPGEIVALIAAAT